MLENKKINAAIKILYVKFDFQGFGTLWEQTQKTLITVYKSIEFTISITLKIFT